MGPFSEADHKQTKTESENNKHKYLKVDLILFSSYTALFL